VLSFKQALFDGVLDGGPDEVFLGGTRLTKFMESVESVVEHVPAEHTPASDETDRETKESVTEAPEEEPPAPVAEPPSAGEQVWAEVLDTGLALLEKIGAAMSSVHGTSAAPAAEALPGRGPGGARAKRPGTSPLAPLVERDAETGRAYLRIPVPGPEVAARIAGLLALFTGGAAAAKEGRNTEPRRGGSS
jgi:hypothetical protein